MHAIGFQARLAEDAGHLAPADEDVVRPLDLRGDLRATLGQPFVDRDRGDQRQLRDARRLDVRGEQDREIDVLPGGRLPAPPHPPPPGGLGVGDDHGALDRTLPREVPDRAVRRVDRVVVVDAPPEGPRFQVRRHFGGERNVRDGAQEVALLRGGDDPVPRPLQFPDVLPDRAPGDAEPPADLRSGEVLAPSLEQLQYPFSRLVHLDPWEGVSRAKRTLSTCTCAQVDNKHFKKVLKYQEWSGCSKGPRCKGGGVEKRELGDPAAPGVIFCPGKAGPSLRGGVLRYAALRPRNDFVGR